MNGLSVNRACSAGAAFLGGISLIALAAIFLLTKNPMIVWLGLLFIALVFACVVLFIVFLRRKLVLFSDSLCRTIDDMLDGTAPPPQIYEEENLFYKINHRLLRLYEVMQENRERVAKDRANLQELISDISHQVKTPIANLQMVNATLLEQSVPEEKRQEFLQASSGQLDKLDFLMQAMIKTSRLETGVISLDRKTQLLYDTLAAALGGILLNAEKKNIHVSVDCPLDLALAHDRKWTGEALFNLLDNAVKYRNEEVPLKLKVTTRDLSDNRLQICVADNGIGIRKDDLKKVFDKFYRVSTGNRHDVKGFGLGLAYVHKMVKAFGGDISVESELKKGTKFIVILPLTKN